MNRNYITGATLALALICPTLSSAQVAQPDIQARQDFKLTEIEPFYTRYKALTACVRMMLANTSGNAEDQAKLTMGLCQEKANDLRAILGSKIGAPRATRVIEVFRSDLVQLLKKQEEAAAQAKLSPDERIAKQSFWSSGPWHVLKPKTQCIALHRFQGSTTFGGLSFAGGTPQDILIGDDGKGARVYLFTPSAGHAQDFLPYADKTVNVVISVQPLAGGREQRLQAEATGRKSGDTAYLDLDSLDEVEKTLVKYKSMSFESVGDGANGLSGYRYDLTGLGDAIAAYRRCVG
jgi:hypothetical protein